MDLKSAVAGNDEEAILNECIRGEESAVEAYEEALKDTTLVGPARKTVIAQLEKISTALVDIRKMANSYAMA